MLLWYLLLCLIHRGKKLKHKQRFGYHVNDGHPLGIKYRLNRSHFLKFRYFSCAFLFKLDEFLRIVKYTAASLASRYNSFFTSL